jgi:rSAM/selenodomain-associated transferase 2
LFAIVCNFEHLMKISIIIPTYNEANYLASTLTRVKALEGDFEIVVVDGESSDATTQIARELGVAVVQAPRGRASQMNYGSSLAQGEVLLFLHADTRLPESTYRLITTVLSEPEVVGGCFRLRFDADCFGLRFSAFFTRFSVPLFHYGDSSYFVRTQVFRELQGYRSYPIMEDLDLWLRMRRCGKLKILTEPVVTSSRRFLRNGVLKQQTLGIALVLFFLLGVNPNRLKKFYGEVR